MEGVGAWLAPDPCTVVQGSEKHSHVENLGKDSKESLWVFACSVFGPNFHVRHPKQIRGNNAVDNREVDRYPLLQSFAVACRINEISYDYHMGELEASQADVPQCAHPGSVSGAHGNKEEVSKSSFLLLLFKYSLFTMVFCLIYRVMTFCLQATRGSEACFSPAFSLTTMTVGSSPS